MRRGGTPEKMEAAKAIDWRVHELIIIPVTRLP